MTKVIWEYKTVDGQLYERYVGWDLENGKEIRFGTEDYPEWTIVSRMPLESN